MKKTSGHSLFRLFLSSGMILAMIQYNTIPVFGVNENPEEQLSDINRETETDESGKFPIQTAPSAEADPIEVLFAAEETKDNTEHIVSEQSAASGEDTLDDGSAQENETDVITIDSINFSPEDDETSGWSNGKGWKNVAGQYIAMVDFDGSDSTISANIDVLTLAVAGINRIGTLAGDCSYQIVGSGIVLIDNIDIDEGNALTLHPNTALYNEGSAAVFLKQDDGSYLLINGSTTGILDGDYILDNVNLRIPNGSSLTLNVMVVRTETWTPDGTQDPVTDTTIYMDEEPPYDIPNPTKTDGTVEINDYAARLTLGKNSSLTVDKGASIQLKEIPSFSASYLPFIIKAVINIQGTLNIEGTIEGGYIDITSDGSLTAVNEDGSSAKEGKILSSEIILNNEGNLQKDLLLEDCSLTVNDNIVSATIDSSVIYLKGTDAYIQELDVSGECYIGVGLFDSEGSALAANQEIGNITIQEGSTLYIAANDHFYLHPPKYVEDCSLTISGTITGGTVSVLAGIVKYTGNDMEHAPAVLSGYTSRVLYVNGTEEIISTEFPLNMTQAETAARAKTDEISLTVLSVTDTLVADDILVRAWLSGQMEKEPILRDTDKEYTCESFLQTYTPNDYDPDYNSPENSVITDKKTPGVELIYENLARERYWIDDPAVFTLNDVIIIRVLNCTGQGGQGGGSSTNTYTSFTGNGQIGGSGGDTVQLGSGIIIYGTQSTTPEEPEPEEPAPTEKPDPDKPSKPQKSESDDHKENDNTSAQSDSSNTDAGSGSESTAEVWTVPETKNNTYTAPDTYKPINIPQTAAVSTYNIYFNTDGGTKIDFQTVNAGTKAAKPNDPVKEGFIFGGWYKDQECTEIFDFQIPVSGNTTIYAKWTEKEHTAPETIKPAEPEKKSMSWIWIVLAALGAAGAGTCIVLLRKDEEDE